MEALWLWLQVGAVGDDAHAARHGARCSFACDWHLKCVLSGEHAHQMCLSTGQNHLTICSVLVINCNRGHIETRLELVNRVHSATSTVAGFQVVANVFQWPKLQAMVEKSFLVQEFLLPRSTATPIPVFRKAPDGQHNRGQSQSQRPAPHQRHRKLTAFARNHSLTKISTEATSAAALKTATSPSATLPMIVEQVQQAAEMALGGKLTPTQPLIDAGMDSLGEIHLCQPSCSMSSPK